MRTNVIIFSVLLALGLGLAYLASLPKNEKDSQTTRWWTVKPESVTTVSVEAKNESVVATKQQDNQVWIDYSKTTPAPAPDPKATPAPPPPAPQKEEERFLANDKLKTDVLAAFNPLEALRVIGKVEGDALDEFGLKDPEATFRIEAGGDKLSYELKIGKKSYGSANVFVLDAQKNNVLLIDGTAIDTLRKARGRLYERRVFSFTFEDAATVWVQAPGADEKAPPQGKKMVQGKKDENGEPQWADEGENAPVKPSYKSWLGKVEKIRVANFAKKEDLERLASVQPFLKIAFAKNTQPLDSLEFKKIEEPVKAENTVKAKPDEAAEPKTTTSYWVTSEFLKTWVKLNAARMEQVDKDLPSIVGK